MVCEPSLAYCAKDIGLGKYILLGRGEEATGGRDRDSIISDVMEAVIGAVFLDGGIEYAKNLFFNSYSLTWKTKYYLWTAKHFYKKRFKRIIQHSFDMSW